MATAVASRFAVLSIDDDDDFPKKTQPKKKPEPKKGGAPGSAQSNASKKKNPKKVDAGKGNQTTNNNNNNTTKSKGKTGGKSDGNKDNSQKKKGNISQDQWDQWKKKDSELVDCTFEQDMHQAILLSKLDYEEKKELYEQLKKNAEDDKKQHSSKKSKKGGKVQTMSLEEFNSRHSESPLPDSDSLNAMKDESLVQPDREFFDRIKDDTKKVLTKEHEVEKRKAREPFIQETITVAHLEDRLEKRNQENKALKEEIVKLKEELHNVKTRNKKLCNILGQGEMKDKAEVLVEVERLQRMRDELSSEVSSLHAQLEQERSKVRALTADTKGKSQNKKRSTSETNQQ